MKSRTIPKFLLLIAASGCMASACRQPPPKPIVAGAVESMIAKLGSTCGKFQRELTGFVAWMGGEGGMQPAAAGNSGEPTELPTVPCP